VKYISIDGDDIGSKITACYLRNDECGLSELSASLKKSTNEIAIKLKKIGFNVIFCAADGVVASINSDINLNSVFLEFKRGLYCLNISKM